MAFCTYALDVEPCLDSENGVNRRRTFPLRSHESGGNSAERRDSHAHDEGMANVTFVNNLDEETAIVPPGFKIYMPRFAVYVRAVSHGYILGFGDAYQFFFEGKEILLLEPQPAWIVHTPAA